MRRLMSVVAIVLLSSVLAGCRSTSHSNTGSCGREIGCSTGCETGGKARSPRVHTYGICDCEYDDYCSSRSPWIRQSATKSMPSAPLPMPGKLPDVKMGL